MANIPYEAQQRLPITIEQIEHQIAQGMAVSGDELRRAVEWSAGRRLDDRLRKVISMFSVPPQKRRGRPCSGKGPEDFALEEVDALYPALLQKYEEKPDNGVVLRQQRVPSSRAQNGRLVN